MKKPKAPPIVTVAIFTTITIIFWVFFSLYSILTTKPPTIVDPKLLDPLNPELDRVTLDKLGDRIFFEESDITSPFVVSVSPLPTPQTTPEPESLESNEETIQLPTATPPLTQ